MIRGLYQALPGPAIVRILVLVVIAAVALVALFLVFEAAGDLLDDGGVIGP